MEICAKCASELDPSWKFCIKCGTPVPAGAAHPTRDEQNATKVAPPAGAKPASKRTPRRAKSSFAPRTTSTPVATTPSVTSPAKPAAVAAAPDVDVENEVIIADPVVEAVIQDEAPVIDDKASVIQDEAPAERPLTPESALIEPVLPRVARHGGETHDLSRLGQAWSDYAQSEHEAADAATAETTTPTEATAPVEAPAIPFVEDENPFSHNLPPRPDQPKTRAEAKAAAAVRAATRARTMADAKAEIRAKYPIPSASADNPSLEYTEDNPLAFRTGDKPLGKRKIDVPLVVSISLSTAGVILIVYLAILVFGARG